MKKKKMGAPSLYKPEYIHLLIEHGKNGNPFETFGAEVGVSVATLYNWCDAHPDFLEAKKIAYCFALKWWFEQGKNNLIMPEGEKFSATIWIFTMKAMFQLRDGSESKAQLENPVGKTREQLDVYQKELDSLKDALEIGKLRLVK